MKTTLMKSLPALLITLLLGIWAPGLAQKSGQALADSLKGELPKATDPVVTMTLLWHLDSTYITLNIDSSQKYAKMRLAVARQFKDKNYITRALISLARCCFYTGQYDDIIKYCQEAVQLSEGADGQLGNRGLAFLDIGAAYLSMGNYTSSLEYSLKGLPCLEAAKDSASIILSDVNAGLAFYYQDDLDKARAYEEKGLVMANLRHNSYGQKKALQMLGVILVKQKKNKESLSYFDQCIRLMQDTKDSIGLATIYNDMVAVFQHVNNDSSLYYGLKAKAIWDRAAPDYFLATENNANIAEIYENMALDSLPDKTPGWMRTPQEKRALLLKAEDGMVRMLKIFNTTKKQEDVIYFDKQLSIVQHALHEDAVAYDNLSTSVTLSDSVHSQENKNKMAGLEEEREIAVRDKQLTISRLEIENQKKQRWYFISGLVLLFVIGGLLYWQNRVRKRTNTVLIQLNTQLDEANEIKTRFFNILNHDLRAPVANLINFIRLQQEAPELVNESVRVNHTQRLQDNAENLLVTMEDLLLWSKGQMKAFKLQVKPVPVEKLFSELRDHFAGVGNVRLSFEAGLLLLNTDEHYLKTIMRNLTNNAIKVLNGAPNASIVWKAWEENGKQYLSVTDNGPGVGDQQLMALYNDSATVGIKAGLGFHLVRDLARAIHCQISVKSLPGQGVEFKLAL